LWGGWTFLIKNLIINTKKLVLINLKTSTPLNYLLFKIIKKLNTDYQINDGTFFQGQKANNKIKIEYTEDDSRV
jgi:hypothetical protein